MNSIEIFTHLWRHFTKANPAVRIGLLPGISLLLPQLPSSARIQFAILVVQVLSDVVDRPLQNHFLSDSYGRETLKTLEQIFP